MIGSKTVCLGVAIFAFVTVPAQAQHHGVHTASWHHGHGTGGQMGFSNGSQGLFLVSFGYGGWYAPPPILMMNQGGFFPFGAMIPPPMRMRGPLLPPPLPGMMAPIPNVNAQPSDPVRAGQRVTVGDRLLRAGNVKKAEERYQQASRTAPDLAAPRVRLAQIAFVRGNYTDAALKFREAETAQPGWIITAPDIQSIYGEPTEFARHIAKLESHIQSHPDDRDAWLVLGAEWFLTGRTAKAADVFQRLNDPRRKPDVALAAFLDASNQAALRPGNLPDPRQDPPK
jgi:predicted Zn-dependent protease